jgi:hypothetical protein
VHGYGVERGARNARANTPRIENASLVILHGGRPRAAFAVAGGREIQRERTPEKPGIVHAGADTDAGQVRFHPQRRLPSRTEDVALRKSERLRRRANGECRLHAPKILGNDNQIRGRIAAACAHDDFVADVAKLAKPPQRFADAERVHGITRRDEQQPLNRRLARTHVQMVERAREPGQRLRSARFDAHGPHAPPRQLRERRARPDRVAGLRAGTRRKQGRE